MFIFIVINALKYNGYNKVNCFSLSQELRMGPLTPEVATKITSIWLMGYCAFYFGGPFIAGFLTDYLSFSGMTIQHHAFKRTRSIYKDLFMFKIF